MGTGLQPPSWYGVVYRVCCVGAYLVADVGVWRVQVPGLGTGPDIPPYLRSNVSIRARLIRREEVLKLINEVWELLEKVSPALLHLKL